MASTCHTHAGESPQSRSPWWLVPNLLSLDAPLVAVVWLGLFSAAFQVPVAAIEYLLLGIAVWVVYVVDRLVDARFPDDPDAATPRHRFYARHWKAFALTALIAVAGGLVLAFWLLAKPLLSSGLGLSAMVTAYLTLILIGRTWPRSRYFGKEWVIGFVFSAGVFLPVFARASRDQWPGLAVLWVTFGLLCALNCVGIACWEIRRDARDDPDAITRHWPAIEKGYGAMLTIYCCLLVLAGFLVTVTGTAFEPLACMWLGTLGLGLLHTNCRRMHEDVLRVLADAALLFPPLGALAIRWTLVAL